jgi:hypothetical protein
MIVPFLTRKERFQKYLMFGNFALTALTSEPPYMPRTMEPEWGLVIGLSRAEDGIPDTIGCATTSGRITQSDRSTTIRAAGT